MSQFKIPLAKPDIIDEDRQAILKVLEGDQLSQGPWMEAFEKIFRTKVERGHALAVSSGTAGLHLAIRALGISEGDEVITTPFSFVASANAICYEGATPVFVDIEEETFGINPDLLERSITSKTKAVLAVHVFGRPCKIGAVRSICDKYGLALIEDCCESLLSRHEGLVVGSFGEIAAYGFYPNKQITTGEGGMVTLNRDDLASTIRSLRNQGRDQNQQNLVHNELGYNYRLSEINAALGFSQMQRVEGILKRRGLVFAKYKELLDAASLPIYLKPLPTDQVEWFVFAIRVPRVRDKVMERLLARGIQCKAYFDPPIHLQPLYQKLFGYRPGVLPVSERLSNEILILPYFTSMSTDEVSFVVSTLKEVL